MHQACRRGTQRHRIGPCERLEAGRNVGGVAHGERFLTRALCTNDGQARVQTEAYGDTHPIVWFQMAIQRSQRVENGQAGVHGQ